MRTKPSAVTGKSPASLFMGQHYADHLAPLHPRTLEPQHAATSEAVNPFVSGATVWAVKHSGEKAFWVPGTVSALRGVRACDV